MQRKGCSLVPASRALQVMLAHGMQVRQTVPTGATACCNFPGPCSWNLNEPRGAALCAVLLFLRHLTSSATCHPQQGGDLWPVDKQTGARP